MKSIPLYSKDQSIMKSFKKACSQASTEIRPVILQDKNSMVSFLNYELPEVKFFDFTNARVECEDLLQIVHSDPWLLFGGIVVIAENQSQKNIIEKLRDPNILLVLTRSNFLENSERLLKVIIQNSEYLFNRGMQQQLQTNETGFFTSENDPIDILFYCNLITSYLYNTNRINEEERSALQSALMELLLNAVEHGNCKIGYDEKTNWLSEGKNMLDLIAIKSKLPENQHKRVYITYEISNTKTKITVKDDGDGFDWKKRLEMDLTAGLHGMGIKLAETFVSKITYNEKGNIAQFYISNQTNSVNSIPIIMREQERYNLKDKQIVCRENETTNDLFYIISGKFAVYVQRKLVSVLTPKDIFIGEMSFLLNDRRSATIISIGDSSVVRIPKMEFINLIRKHPHYAMFLARLLAQRLDKQSNKTVEVTNEWSKTKEELTLLKNGTL